MCPERRTSPMERKDTVLKTNDVYSHYSACLTHKTWLSRKSSTVALICNFSWNWSRKKTIHIKFILAYCSICPYGWHWIHNDNIESFWKIIIFFDNLALQFCKSSDTKCSMDSHYQGRGKINKLQDNTHVVTHTSQAITCPFIFQRLRALLQGTLINCL